MTGALYAEPPCQAGQPGFRERGGEWRRRDGPGAAVNGAGGVRPGCAPGHVRTRASGTGRQGRCRGQREGLRPIHARPDRQDPGLARGHLATGWRTCHQPVIGVSSRPASRQENRPLWPCNRRIDGPDRVDHPGQGHHPGPVAGSPAPRPPALLRRAIGADAGRLQRRGQRPAAAGPRRSPPLVPAGRQPVAAAGHHGCPAAAQGSALRPRIPL